MAENLPATLESVIVARIGPIIGEMIPEESLRQTVKTTVDRFMTVELPGMLKKELTERFTAIIKRELDGPGYREIYGAYGQEAGPRTQEMIKELMPEIIAAAMAAPFNRLLCDMRNNLHQLTRNY